MMTGDGVVILILSVVCVALMGGVIWACVLGSKYETACSAWSAMYKTWTKERTTLECRIKDLDAHNTELTIENTRLQADKERLATRSVKGGNAISVVHALLGQARDELVKGL
jgi:hypothetical protein